MKPRVVVLLLAIAALIAKLYCASTTIGTSDVVFFYDFARTIHEQGLLAMYKATSFFNHTPLVGWFSEAAYALSGGEKPFFVFYLRLPAIFADFFGVIALLWYQEKTGRPMWWRWVSTRRARWPSWFPATMGNVDSVMALGVLLAGIACAMDRPALCGLCLGLACNIKIIPLILAPAFFFVCWQRRQALRFMIPAVLTVLVGWSYPLLTIPTVFLKDVLGYGSIWGVWGITYALRLTDLPAFRNIAFANTTPEQAAIISGLKLLIVVLALAIAWRRRKVEPPEIFQTLALIWAVFFVFAPGFGAQYLAWIMPCFLVQMNAGTPGSPGPAAWPCLSSTTRSRTGCPGARDSPCTRSPRNGPGRWCCRGWRWRHSSCGTRAWPLRNPPSKWKRNRYSAVSKIVWGMSGAAGVFNVKAARISVCHVKPIQPHEHCAFAKSQSKPFPLGQNPPPTAHRLRGVDGCNVAPLRYSRAIQRSPARGSVEKAASLRLHCRRGSWQQRSAALHREIRWRHGRPPADGVEKRLR